MKCVVRQERIFGHEVRYIEDIENGSVIAGWMEEKIGDVWRKI